MNLISSRNNQNFANIGKNRFSKLDFARIQKRAVEIPKTKTVPKKIVKSIPKHTPIFIEEKFSFTRVFSFAAVACILIIALQSLSVFFEAKSSESKILGTATDAYSNLAAGSNSLTDQNFKSAAVLFSQAQTNLESARGELDKFKNFIWLKPKAQSAEHILNGASQLAKSGETLAQALQIFDSIKVNKSGIVTENFSEKILASKILLSESHGLIKAAEEEFKNVKEVPQEYTSTLAVGQTRAESLSAVLKNLIQFEDIYLSLFNERKSYLLVFQNYDELRATGGFFGTYGVLSVDGGKIKKLKIESIYNLDGRIFDNAAAPGPFQPEIKKWGIRDANWFADFPTSAQKLLSLFELGSSSADGVIAFTPKLFEDLFALTGPIEMKEYGVTLDASNFQEIVQYKTSVDYDKTLNQPKKLLDDLAPLILNRLQNLNNKQWLQLFDILKKNLDEKHVLLYSKDSSVQQKIELAGFSGKIAQTDRDYLSVVNSNLGGTKTDLEMEQFIDIDTKILSDGSVVNNLHITRVNHSNMVNRNYMRVLVPEGSTLVSSEGAGNGLHLKSEALGLPTDEDLHTWDQGELMFENIFVRKEAGKTEFAAWLEIASGEAKKITFSYVLPFKLKIGILNPTDTYSMLFQTQPGSLNNKVQAKINFPFYAQSFHSTNLSTSVDSSYINVDAKTDQYWAIALKK